ncbi:MAG: SH3 domain-containing protein [bacterium]|nr:SH3 domain-containing protein [Clostridium sp.]MCM1538230.1 SH3 domain-containing protein [bacterium]
MKRKELKAAAVLLAGVLSASQADFSANATQVAALLPAEGVELALEESTTVEELEQSVRPGAQSDIEILTLSQEAGMAVAAGIAEPAMTDIVPEEGTGETAADSGEQHTGADETQNPAEDADTDALDGSENADPDAEETTEEDMDAVDGEEPEDTEADADLTDEEDAEEDDEEMPEGYGSLVIARVRDWVNVRSGPTTESEIVGKLYNNSVGELIRREGDWYYIASGTVTGYVSADYCVSGEEAEALIDEVSIQIATVDAQTLKLRAEGSTESRVLQLLPYGDKLEVLESDHGSGWIKVNVNGTQGYVSADYVTVSISFVSAESKAEEEARLAEERAEREAAERRAAELAAQEAAQAAEQAQQPAESSEVVMTAEAPAPVSTGSGRGAEVANYALQFVGNPYVYGGTSLTNGADCSGFVLAVYAQFGISLPHSATADRSMGTAVGTLAEAQPGDLVCYSGHVGIYIGNGQIVHASTPRTGIKISSATYKPIACIRRIFN